MRTKAKQAGGWEGSGASLQLRCPTRLNFAAPVSTRRRSKHPAALGDQQSHDEAGCSRYFSKNCVFWLSVGKIEAIEVFCEAGEVCVGGAHLAMIAIGLLGTW